MITQLTICLTLVYRSIHPAQGCLIGNPGPGEAGAEHFLLPAAERENLGIVYLPSTPFGLIFPAALSFLYLREQTMLTLRSPIARS